MAEPPDRPYVLVSCAVSLDGHLDDTTDRRLLLSNPADLDEVDGLRATCDAILVGAGTVRRDDPGLQVRDPDRRRARVGRGQPATPVRVTVTGSGGLDPAARFFAPGEPAPLVYCATPALAVARGQVGAVATVVDAGTPVDPHRVLADLAGRGVGRLLVEGGSRLLTWLLTAGLADELRLAVAPLFVGDARAPRFPGEGRFPWHAGARAGLAGVGRVGDVAVLRYRLSDRAPA